MTTRQLAKRKKVATTAVMVMGYQQATQYGFSSGSTDFDQAACAA